MEGTDYAGETTGYYRRQAEKGFFQRGKGLARRLDSGERVAGSGSKHHHS